MSDEQETYNPEAPVKFDPKSGFEFSDIDGMFRAAKCYLQSGFAPSAFRTPQQLIMAWARGAELGLRPMQAIEGLTVINNRIGIMGDLALAMVRQSGLLAKYEKEWTGQGDNLTCKVTLQRKGDLEHEYTFSVLEAKQAGIYERSTTWKGYPKRMTYYRALGFGLRDDFSDVLKNMYTSEELEDLAHFENLADNKTVQFVSVDGTQEEAAAAANQTTSTPPPQNVPPLQAQLEREHPEAAAKKEEKLMGPSADFAESQAQARAATQAPSQPMSEPSSAAPDDIDLGPAPEPEKPWWVEYKVQGVKSLLGRTIQSLNPTEMAAIESRLVPTFHARIAEATDAQRKDLEAFEARIAHDKTAKPW